MDTKEEKQPLDEKEKKEGQCDATVKIADKQNSDKECREKEAAKEETKEESPAKKKNDSCCSG